MNPCLSNGFTMLHRVWLALFSGDLRTLLSPHGLAVLYWDGLTELSRHGGTLLPGNLTKLLYLEYFLRENKSRPTFSQCSVGT